MMSLALHIKCSIEDLATCSNISCKTATVLRMHETARRLMAVGLAKGAKSFSGIARALGASDQSATNWKSRGVPSDVMIRAAALYGADAAWIAGDPSGQEPAFLTDWKYPKAPTLIIPRVSEEHRGQYSLNDDEQRLLDGYRIADDSLRRSMLLLASDAIDRFGKRRANHNAVGPCA